MFCKNCGASMEDTATVCPVCQTPVTAEQQPAQQQPMYQQPVYQQQPYQQPPVEDRPSCWIGGVSFCIPIVGLILFLVWRDQKPVSSKSAGKMALIGFILSVIGSIIYTVIITVAGVSLSGLI